MHHSQMIETLKSSFLFNFRTGNVLVDTFITGFIVILSTYIFSMTNQIHQKLKIYIQNLFKYLKGDQESVEMVICGRKIDSREGSRLEYSTTFQAIFHQIKQLNCKEAGIYKMKEIMASSYNRHGKQVTSDNMIVSQANSFSLTAKISGKVTIENNTVKELATEINKEGKTANCIEFKIVIFSKDLSMDELRETVESWAEEFQEFMGNDKSLKYFHYNPTKATRGADPFFELGINYNNYTELKFESGKSFDNVFFPEKDEMVKNLDYFSGNKDWYKRKGIPYTMGFLFHGEPGCGKTSTIKAIANYTGRHIISIPLHKIKTYNELITIFYNTSINQKIIPLAKRLYVLEDIDCSNLKDIVKDRGEEEEERHLENQQDQTENELLKKLLNLKVSPVEAFDKKTELTLSALLEILDGVMEMDGRMMVITTNYPDKLDKALIRPGRIDMNIKFGKCSSDTLTHMYQNFYDSELKKGIVLPENKWTPAEATKIFLQNLRNPSNCLDQLLA